MIVDCHTHIFPTDVLDRRDDYRRDDPTFAALYGGDNAKLAGVEDLLSSMERAAVDVSLALGFAWLSPETCRRHNDYLLESAAASNGRVLAFCNLPLAAGPGAIAREAERCLAGGAAGFGELRPESVGADLKDHETATALAEATRGRPLLFHVSEPAGHDYPGKQGLRLEDFYGFVLGHTVPVIGAHWGGGLPFYSLMPEVKMALTDSYVDTAGTSLLYKDSIYEQVAAEIGAKRILFGSDYPLLSQARSRRRIEESNLGPADKADILGNNACDLLNLR